MIEKKSVSLENKCLTIMNSEDITSYRIFIVDDVYEIGPNETAYECTVYKVNFIEGFDIKLNKN